MSILVYNGRVFYGVDDMFIQADLGICPFLSIQSRPYEPSQRKRQNFTRFCPILSI